MANEEMREYWNADGSMSWVRAADRYDAQLTPFVDDIIGAAAPAVGDAVIDIGCGTGALSRAAAGVVGPGGSVAGLDISAPFLEEARRRSAAVAQVRFAECDAQTADLAPYAAAVAISRFGVMFFDDPVAAFANIARGVVAGGRLAFACWRPAFENEWITVPMGAVVGVLGMPDLPGPGAPGPFQMGDADFVRDAAGVRLGRHRDHAGRSPSRNRWIARPRRGGRVPRRRRHRAAHARRQARGPAGAGATGAA